MSHIPGHLGDEGEGYQPQRSFHMFHFTMAKSEREGLSLAGDDCRDDRHPAGFGRKGCLVGQR